MRAAAGFTQRELAEALELPLVLLQRYEKTNRAPLYIHLAIHLFITMTLAERERLTDLYDDLIARHPH